MRPSLRVALVAALLLPTLAEPAAAAQGKKKKSGAATPVSGTSGASSGASSGTTTGAGTTAGSTPLGPYAGPQSRSWTACGGLGALSLVCAAIDVTVDGTSTTIGVRNLSGASSLALDGQPVTSAGQWVITKVGFDNVPSAVSTTGAGATGGSWLARTAVPRAWSAFDDRQFGGGERIDLGITNGTGISGGIASSCAPQGTLPGGSSRLWMTDNPACAAYGIAGNVDAGFRVDVSTTAAWNPNAADVTLYFKAQNGPGGASYECILGGATARGNCYGIDAYGSGVALPPGQVVPEPGTLVLMASGVAGLGVLAWRRRGGQAPGAVRPV